MPPEHEANNTDVCEAVCLFHETSAVVIFFFVVRFSAGASPQAPTTPHRRCGWSALFSVVSVLYIPKASL